VGAQTVPDIKGRDTLPGGFHRVPPGNLEVIRESLHDLADQIAREKDLRKLLMVLPRVMELKSELALLIDDFQARCHSLMDKKKIDLGEGIGLVEKVHDSNTKWDTPALIDALLSACKTADQETGEVTFDGELLAKTLRDAAQIAYWRKTTLRAMDIDPDQYSETTYGKPRVRLHSREGKGGRQDSDRNIRS